MERFLRETVVEDPISETIKLTEYDSNIQIQLKISIQNNSGMADRDSYVLQYISAVLSSGKAQEW